MKRYAVFVAPVMLVFLSGCVYHYGATVVFTSQPQGGCLREVELSSTVAGASSMVITKIRVDASLQQFVNDRARASGFLSGELKSITIRPTKREGEREAVEVVVDAVSHSGASSDLSGSFVIFGGWIRGIHRIHGLSEDSTGVVVQPSQGRFREFAISDAAVLRTSIMIAVQRALDRLKEPNQTPEPTTTLVTPRADARVAPSVVVAHL